VPFRSQAQRRFLYSQHPEIAKRWQREYGSSKSLPEHVRKNKKRPKPNKLSKALRGS
jgi:hypothetical protein